MGWLSSRAFCKMQKQLVQASEGQNFLIKGRRSSRKVGACAGGPRTGVPGVTQ